MDIHGKCLAEILLHVHLEDEQPVVFRDEELIIDIAARPNKNTKLAERFVANSEYSGVARGIKYRDFAPSLHMAHTIKQAVAEKAPQRQRYWPNVLFFAVSSWAFLPPTIAYCSLRMHGVRMHPEDPRRRHVRNFQRSGSSARPSTRGKGVLQRISRGCIARDA